MTDGIQNVSFIRVCVEVKLVFDRCSEGDKAYKSVIWTNLELTCEVFDKEQLLVKIGRALTP